MVSKSKGLRVRRLITSTFIPFFSNSFAASNALPTIIEKATIVISEPSFSTLDFLTEVNDYGISRLIFTDINKDGTKESPNFEETLKVAEISNCPVIISGGVSSIEDIKKAKTLKNIEGVIVGKAIYDGDIKLEELAKEDA